MASIVIDGVVQPGNENEGTYPKFVLDSRSGQLSIQLAAPHGTPGSSSGGITILSFLGGDDANLCSLMFMTAASNYTPPANLPPTETEPKP